MVKNVFDIHISLCVCVSFMIIGFVLDIGYGLFIGKIFGLSGAIAWCLVLLVDIFYDKIIEVMK